MIGLDPPSWPADVRATMLNQYRFLKAVELGAGLFCLAFRRDILAGGRPAGVFLAIVALGVAARTTAWIADGRPATLFVIFLVLEIVVLVVVLLHLRQAHGRHRA